MSFRSQEAEGARGVPDAEQRDVIDDRAAERTIGPGIVVGAEEDDPGALGHGGESENGPLEASGPFRIVGNLNGGAGREGLDHHGPRAGVAGVAHGEGEGVDPADDGAGDLGEGALLAPDQLDCALALGNLEVGGVDVVDGLEGLHHPAGERRVVVLDVGRDQHAPRRIWQDVGPFLEVGVLQ